MDAKDLEKFESESHRVSWRPQLLLKEYKVLQEMKPRTSCCQDLSFRFVLSFPETARRYS